MDDNPHTAIQPWCSVVYWRGNAAAGKQDAWTHCYVHVHQFPSLRFERAQEPAARDVVEALRQAYERGRGAKAREFRRVLDCAPSSSQDDLALFQAATAARRPSDAAPEGQPAPAGEQPREAK